MPSLVKLYNEFKSRGLVVLAISVQEKKAIVQKYADSKKLPFPVLLDTKGEIARDYGIRGHPAHFLIDRQGEMLGKVVGARDWTDGKSRKLIRFLVNKNKKE